MVNIQTVGVCGNVDTLLEHDESTAVEHADEFTERLLHAVALAGDIGRTEARKVGHLSGELVERQALEVVVVEQQMRADLIKHVLDPRHSHVLHLHSDVQAAKLSWHSAAI